MIYKKRLVTIVCKMVSVQILCYLYNLSAYAQQGYARLGYAIGRVGLCIVSNYRTVVIIGHAHFESS